MLTRTPPDGCRAELLRSCNEFPLVHPFLMSARSSMRGDPNLEFAQRAYKSRVAVAQAIAALLGRFLPRLGLLHSQGGLFFGRLQPAPVQRSRLISDNAEIRCTQRYPPDFAVGRTKTRLNYSRSYPAAGRSESPDSSRLIGAFMHMKRRGSGAAEQTSLLAVVVREQETCMADNRNPKQKHPSERDRRDESRREFAAIRSQCDRMHAILGA